MDGSRSAAVAWQRWRLELPGRWSPVKLEGNAGSGYALFADLHRPRLGLRWTTPKKKKNFDAAAHARELLRREVGELAAAEARDWPMEGGEWTASLLYVEPEPPGRDVWVGISGVSGRAVEMIYHARRRERLLAETILPTLMDAPAQGQTPWSVFELSCVVPAELELESQRLNAGDLSLTFAESGKVRGRPPRRVTVRQVAVAQLALARMPLERWLAQQQATRRKYCRPHGKAEAVSLQAGAPGQKLPGRTLEGLKRLALRRRRYFFRRDMARRVMTYAMHDRQRDRLVLIESENEELAMQVAATVGWAGTRPSNEAAEP